MAKQSIIPKDYIKVGRISMTIAHEAHIKAADIVVTQNYLNHVDNVHKLQLIHSASALSITSRS